MKTVEEIEAAFEAMFEAFDDDDVPNPVVPFKKEYRSPDMPDSWGNLYYYLDWTAPEDGADLPGIGFVKLVEQHGGEGLGDDAWFVIDVDGRTFHIQGYHVSHDGTHYEGPFTEVKPVQVLKTEWQSV